MLTCIYQILNYRYHKILYCRCHKMLNCKYQKMLNCRHQKMLTCRYHKMLTRNPDKTLNLQWGCPLGRNPHQGLAWVWLHSKTPHWVQKRSRTKRHWPSDPAPPPFWLHYFWRASGWHYTCGTESKHWRTKDDWFQFIGYFSVFSSCFLCYSLSFIQQAKQNVKIHYAHVKQNKKMDFRFSIQILNIIFFYSQELSFTWLTLFSIIIQLMYCFDFE